MTEISLKLLPRAILARIFGGNERAIRSYDTVQKEALVELPIGVDGAQTTANLGLATAEQTALDLDTLQRAVQRLEAGGQAQEAERQEAEDRILVSQDQLAAIVQSLSGEATQKEIDDLRREIAFLRALVASLLGEDNPAQIQVVQQAIDGLAPVAYSGAYADLSGTPALAAVATSGAYSDLSGTPITQTGWTADTGSSDRTAHANYSGTASVAYTQSELQGVMDRLAIVTQQIKALKDDLTAYGAIGP